ncbi:MAG: hypothetical protein ACXVPN_09240 [Bacteroidia bacterium]
MPVTDKKLTFVPVIKKTLLLAFASLFFVRCSNKLEILAPYKEEVAVYGLINQNDSVQYIRVQRIYLGEGNAITMAQNQDSCYFKPGEITVKLQRFLNGNQVSVDNPATANKEIVLTEAYVPLQSGNFNTNQLIYKTTHKLYDSLGSVGGCEYKLVIHSNKTGKEFTSSNVGLIGNFKTGLIYAPSPDNSVLTNNPPPSFPTPQIYLVPNSTSGSTGTVNCLYRAPVNASVCGLYVRFHYTEYSTSTSAGVPKYVDVNEGIQYCAAQDGTDKIDLSFTGDGMIASLVSIIPDNGGVDHRTADSVHFILNAGGYDVSLYNQVNSSTSLSQTKPTYSNINGGVGIFSCRKDFYLLKKIQNDSKDRLASDPKTCFLHFLDHSGNKSTLCP